MALSLMVEGDDLLDYVLAGTLEIQRTADGTSGVLSFTLIGNPGDFTVIEESEVQVLDGSTVLYGGFLRTISRESLARPGRVVVACNAQDYSTLANDDIVTSGGLRTTFESDKARITWLFDTFGTKDVVVGAEVQTLLTDYPPMDFTGHSLADGLARILSFSGGRWYIDESKHLHTYTLETYTAPHALSDTPNGTTTFGYRDMVLPTETTELRNAVWAIPAFGGSAAPTLYTDTSSVTTYGHGRGPRKTVQINENITQQSTLDAFAAAFLADNAHPIQTGSLVTYEPGLLPSQLINITNADHGLVAEQFRITSVSTSFPALENAEYTIEFGDSPAPLRRFTDVPVGGPGGGGTGGGTSGVLGTWQSAVGQGFIKLRGQVGRIWALWVSNVSTQQASGGAYIYATITGGHFVAGSEGFHGMGGPTFGLVIQEAVDTTVTHDSEVAGRDVWLAVPIGMATENPDGSWGTGGGHQPVDGIGTGLPEGCVIFDTFRRSGSGTLGNVSSDGRPWTTNTALTHDVTYGTTGAGAYVTATDDDGTFEASVAGTTGDPWTLPVLATFRVRFRASALGGVFRVQIVGGTAPDYEPAIVWTAFMDNTSGLFGVQDTTQGDSVALTKTNWVTDADYVMEGYADEYAGAGVRVYRVGEPIPPFMPYFYSGGDHVGMATGTKLGVAVANLPDNVTMVWHDLIFCFAPGTAVVDPCAGECGITDTFHRTVPSGFGISDSGHTWVTAATAPGTASVTGGMGYLHTPAGSSNDVSSALTGFPLNGTFNVRVKMRYKTTGHPAGANPELYWPIEQGSGVANLLSIRPGSSHTMTLSSSGVANASVASPWAINTDTDWVYVRWQSVAGVEQKVRIWDVDVAEPSTWNITQNLTGQASWAGGNDPYCQFYLNQSLGSGATYGQQELWIAEVAIDGVDSCGAVQFENFNRTVASGGWGVTTPSGYVWTPATQTALSVNGSQGVVTAPSTAQVNTAQTVSVAIGESAPWVNTSIVTMRTSFQISSVGSASTDYGILSWEIGSDGVTPNFLYEGDIKVNSGTGYYIVKSLPPDEVDHSTTLAALTWTPNVDYNVVWQVEFGVAVRMKVWLASTAEPAGWTVECADTSPVFDGAIASHLIFGFVVRGQTGRTIKINEIEFDYDGKPCSPEPSPDGVDDFTRTVAASTSYTSGFGTGPLGTWQRLDNAAPTSLTNISVNGTAGVAAYAGGGSPAPGRFTYFLLPNAVWNMPIEVTLDVKRDSFSNNLVQLLITDGDNADQRNYVEVECNAGGTSPNGTLILSVDGELPDYGGFSDVAGLFPFPNRGFTTGAGQVVRYKWRIEPTQLLAKAWIATGTEPGTWDVTLAYPAGTVEPLLASGYAHLMMILWCHSAGSTYIDRLEIKTADSGLT